MNDLTEIIEQAEADVQEREAASAAADARAAATQADAVAARENLREARLVLEWLRRHSPAQPDAAPSGQQPGLVQPKPMRFGKPVPDKALTDRCQEAVEEFGGTATNKQILARLIRDGVDANLEQVRNTMAYLSRKKPPVVATEKGSGLWRLLRPVTPDPQMPLLTGTAAMNGATGGER